MIGEGVEMFAGEAGHPQEWPDEYPMICLSEAQPWRIQDHLPVRVNGLLWGTVP